MKSITTVLSIALMGLLLIIWLNYDYYIYYQENLRNINFPMPIDYKENLKLITLFVGVIGFFFNIYSFKSNKKKAFLGIMISLVVIILSDMQLHLFFIF
ncbi:MAG: hypothetical protein ACX93I_11805 [Winogradskyella sp.]